MSKRIIGVLAVAMSLLVPSTGHSAVVAPQVTDAQGDANAINSQDYVYLHNATVNVDSMTPKLGAQPQENLDILSVRFSTESVGGKPTNLLVAMALNGDPKPEDIVRRYYVTFWIGDCIATQELYWAFARAPLPEPTPVGSVTTVGYPKVAHFHRGDCNAVDAKDMDLPKSTIAGKTLTWRIPLSEVGKPGTVLSNFKVESVVRLNGNAPVVTDLASSTKTYRIGT